MRTSLAVLALTIAAPGAALQSQDEFPPYTIVARYGVAPDAFAAVSNAAELVQALRASLGLEVAMPLDEPLQVIWNGALTNPATGGSFPFATSDLGLVLETGGPESGLFAELMRTYPPEETASGEAWDEERAWTWFLEALETGLTRSLASSGYMADAAGNIPLRVVAVHPLDEADRSVEDTIERSYLRLLPSPMYASSAMANAETPEDLAYDVEGLILELEPGPAPAGVEVSAAALERVLGVYDAGPGYTATFRLEDGAPVAAMEGDGQVDVLPLTARSETEFVATAPTGDVIGFTFTIGADGRAESVTLDQSGFTRTWPRKVP